jgi:hypothetical protein
MNKRGFGAFIIKGGWFIGLLALATACIFYAISIKSLAYGLATVDTMTNASDTSLLFAWGINLLEVVGICWILARELRFGEHTNEDRALNITIDIVMGVVLVADFAAIFYASGSLSNLPDSWYGKTLAVVLRLVKSVIGAGGSEILILLGLYLIVEWYRQNNSPQYEYDKTPPEGFSPIPQNINRAGIPRRSGTPFNPQTSRE